MLLRRRLLPVVLASLPLSCRTEYNDESLVPFTFAPLPLGSITPNGWLRDQLQLMADGLAGHEHDFYKYVKDSTWLGGEEEYSDLREGTPVSVESSRRPQADEGSLIVDVDAGSTGSMALSHWRMDWGMRD